MRWLTADSRRLERGKTRPALGTLAALCLCATGIPLVAALGTASPAGAATPAGNIFEVDLGTTGSGSVNGFPTSATGNVAPSLTTTNAVSAPAAGVFDPAGNLWVANLGEASGTTGSGSTIPSITEYTPTELSTGGAPRRTITNSGWGPAAGPSGLAFDAAGNLWVGQLGGNVVEYSAGQLAPVGSITSTPAATLTVASAFVGVTFDSGGNLWVTAAPITGATSAGSIEKFPPSQQVSSALRA